MENILLTSPEPLENKQITIAQNTNILESTESISLKNYSEGIMVDSQHISTKWRVKGNEHGSISIPYFDEDNNEIDVKVYDSSNNFTWLKGVAPEIYGEWRLQKYTDNYLILATSEQDCHILWANSLQAIGISKNSVPESFISKLNEYEYVITLADNTDSSRILYGDLVDKISIDKIFKLNLHSLGYENLLDIHAKGHLNYNLIESNSKSKPPVKKNKEDLHVMLGDRLIAEMNLKYYNDKLYCYVNGVYKVVSDKQLNSYIVKNLYRGAKDTLKKDIRNYVKDILECDDSINIDTNYVNFKNGLYDLKNNKFIPHTPDIFTINQLHVNYLENMPHSNEFIDKFLDDIMCHKAYRIKALLQMAGYCLTTKTSIQKFMIFYGPTASNGKSSVIKILEKILGPENFSSKDLKMLTAKFGVDGIQYKLLNASTEIPTKLIKDTSVLKKTVSGDSFETFKIYEGTTFIISYVKHIFATNHLPQVSDTTNGFFRRVNILLFENQFENNESFLESLITQENLDYLANLALKEFVEMLNSGVLKFANQEESDTLVDEYRGILDTIKGFINDEEYFWITKTNEWSTLNMFENYIIYCRQNKVIPLGKHEFYEKLQTDFGYVKKKNGGTYYFYPPDIPDTEN